MVSEIALLIKRIGRGKRVRKRRETGGPIRRDLSDFEVEGDPLSSLFYPLATMSTTSIPKILAESARSPSIPGT